MADVLEHADADHLVEAAVLRQVTVIQQLQGHAPFQTFLGHALQAQLQLRLAEGDAVDLDVELARGKTRQAAPAATDVEQPVTRLQAQLATQVAQLGLLGLVQVFLAGFEVGAGVDHVAIQPQAVELVGQVVVVADGLGVAAFVVGGVWLSWCGFIPEQRRAQRIANLDGLFDGAFQIHPSLDIGSAQCIQAGMGQLRDQRGILHHQRHPGFGPKVDLLAVPQLQAQR